MIVLPGPQTGKLLTHAVGRRDTFYPVAKGENSIRTGLHKIYQRRAGSRPPPSGNTNKSGLATKTDEKVPMITPHSKARRSREGLPSKQGKGHQDQHDGETRHDGVTTARQLRTMSCGLDDILAETREPTRRTSSSIVQSESA